MSYRWKPLTMTMEELCNGHRDRAIRVEVRDDDGKSKTYN